MSHLFGWLLFGIVDLNSGGGGETHSIKARSGSHKTCRPIRSLWLRPSNLSSSRLQVGCDFLTHFDSELRPDSWKAKPSPLLEVRAAVQKLSPGLPRRKQFGGRPALGCRKGAHASPLLLILVGFGHWKLHFVLWEFIRNV